MIDDLTPNQIQTYLKRIETYGKDGLKGIEIFQAGQLLESITKEMDDIVSRINGIILSNPNYEYPPEYPEGKRTKYWAKSYGYENKRKIRNIIEEFLEQQPKAPTPEQRTREKQFSVLEWATIFYYADETKLTSGHKFLKDRLANFIGTHGITTTLKSLRSKYYDAKNRINKENDYPIDKLESIIPFMKKNYEQTVTKIENDIIFLEDHNADY